MALFYDANAPAPPHRPSPMDRVLGCLLGTAVGDALGLPREGLSPERARRLLGPPDRHALFFGRGALSDDTELTCLVLQSLRREPDDPDACAREFARRLRRWVLALPPGVGLATARAAFRAWILPPPRCGVGSAGNGAAMRSAVVGAFFAERPERIEPFARALAGVTHSDARAVEAAVAIARWAAGLPAEAPEAPPGPKGPTGFAPQTVAAVRVCLETHPDDLRAAVTLALSMGGDADTVAAIVGGVLGSRLGPEAVPADWLAGIADRPRSVAWLRRLAAGEASEPAFPLLLLRNFVVLPLILAHGFRRLIP